LSLANTRDSTIAPSSFNYRMIFTETKLQGVYVIEPERFEDERGFLAPSFSQSEFRARGLAGQFVGNNISYNYHRGTLRGLHYQAAPYGQSKLVRCTRGAVFDVAVDLRRDSATFRQWLSIELTDQNRLMFYIPAELAHGYQTLTDHAEVFYQVSEIHRPEASEGFRWDDPAFGIEWPATDKRIINARDSSYSDFII
jgi:dTDP-4-dehydrorhamnose 3,5-epimerase